jgi:DNA-binding protein H-NS
MNSIKEIDVKITSLQNQAEGIQQELATLMKERAEAVANERAAAVPDLIALITELGLSAADLGLAKQPKPKRVTTTPKKFRDPVSGEEWSGRGAQPRWIQGKDKNLFLIATSDIKTDVEHPSESVNSLVEEPA